MITQRQTDTHFYFWGGVLSNFNIPKGNTLYFKMPLYRGGPAVGFYHSEGAFMALKAMMFGATQGYVDEKSRKWVPSVLEQIFAERNPKAAKALGRSIKRFDPVEWSEHARDFMFRACWAKFTQTMASHDLVATGSRILVEGSPLDEIWGVKLRWDDPLILDSANWRGTNWLGEVLMVVRQLIMELDEREIATFDPFSIRMKDFDGISRSVPQLVQTSSPN
jgi:ribA/ribD-fused uncharacterized protein